MVALGSRVRAGAVRVPEPRATLITTGTGSGKTECFLFPLLDHALRESLAGGVASRQSFSTR